MFEGGLAVKGTGDMRWWQFNTMMGYDKDKFHWNDTMKMIGKGMNDSTRSGDEWWFIAKMLKNGTTLMKANLTTKMVAIWLTNICTIFQKYYQHGRIAKLNGELDVDDKTECDLFVVLAGVVHRVNYLLVSGHF